ncbi:MAG: response regulator [Candidatus Lindowbacteria bacterium]|nr:response regulator [Candidatus Lindowbacteria bacterium]
MSTPLSLSASILNSSMTMPFPLVWPFPEIKDDTPCDLSPPHLLIVEDEADIQRNIEVLFKVKGFKVSCAESGDQVAAFLRKDIPDVVLLDLCLDDCDDEELIFAFKWQLRKTVFVIAYSAHTERKTAALASGADQFISKMVPLPSLLNIVVRHVEEQVRW